MSTRDWMISPHSVHFSGANLADPYAAALFDVGPTPVDPSSGDRAHIQSSTECALEVPRVASPPCNSTLCDVTTGDAFEAWIDYGLAEATQNTPPWPSSVLPTHAPKSLAWIPAPPAPQTARARRPKITFEKPYTFNAPPPAPKQDRRRAPWVVVLRELPPCADAGQNAPRRLNPCLPVRFTQFVGLPPTAPKPDAASGLPWGDAEREGLLRAIRQWM